MPMTSKSGAAKSKKVKEDDSEPETPEGTPEASEDKEDTKEPQRRPTKPQRQAKKLPGDGLVVAKGSFSVGRRIVRKGEIFDRKDSLVQGREHKFAAVADRVRTR